MPTIKHAPPYDVLLLLLIGKLQLPALSDAHPCRRAGVLLLPGSCLAGRAHLQSSRCSVIACCILVYGVRMLQVHSRSDYLHRKCEPFSRLASVQQILHNVMWSTGTAWCRTGRCARLSILSRCDVAQGLARGGVRPGLEAVLDVLHFQAAGAPLGRGAALMQTHAGGPPGGSHARLASLQPLQCLLRNSGACLTCFTCWSHSLVTSSCRGTHAGPLHRRSSSLQQVPLRETDSGKEFRGKEGSQGYIAAEGLHGP